MKPVPKEDDWTEAHSAKIGRVDLVAKAANGSPSFLLMKSGTIGGLLEPDVVRDLIAKATPSDADRMAAIHAASAPIEESEDMAKADPTPDVAPDATLPLADEIPTDAPGDPDDPASPAWEAVDAARARQALQLTLALQRLVSQSKDREAQEVALSDDLEDLSAVWTLEDVGCAIDAIISMLAPFAITEQAEADQGTALEKAAALIKAGRVLSSANEAKIRGAADALQAVLGSLPAPVEDVAKSEETEVSDDITKAKGDPQMAVFDANGKLCGTINPTDLSPIAAPESGEPAAEAPEPAPVVQPDATDGPVAKDGVPIEAPAPVVKSEPTEAPVVKSSEELLKSTIADAVKEALTPLEDRLTKMEAQPMPGGPMLNGALPGADPIALRGQNAGQSDLRKAYEDETNPLKKQELRTQLALDGIRNAPPLR